jgi:hypothetical protein
MKRVKGVVRNKVVVLEEGKELPEGAEVEVRITAAWKRHAAIQRILDNQITRYVGMDEIIEEMKREQNGELPDVKPRTP